MGGPSLASFPWRRLYTDVRTPISVVQGPDKTSPRAVRSCSALLDIGNVSRGCQASERERSGSSTVERATNPYWYSGHVIVESGLTATVPIMIRHDTYSDDQDNRISSTSVLDSVCVRHIGGTEVSP